MLSQRRRGCFLLVVTCCIALAIAGAFAVTGIQTRRIIIAPPAELIAFGPFWIGDFCRDNVAHGRYPPGWCPAEYTVYFIVRTGNKGSIVPMFSIPDQYSSRR